MTTSATSTGIRRLARAVLAGIVTASVSVAATARAGSDDEGIPRIEFAPGTDFGSVAGTVAAGTSNRYVLGATGGQTMTVVVASVEQNAVVTVLAPSGDVLQPSGGPVFVGELPVSGDYVIVVSGMPPGAATTYGLAVHIPPVAGTEPPQPSGRNERISFDPGTDNASRSGAIVLGTTDRYLLDAAAGQTMSVDVRSVEGNAVVNVFSPDGTQLVVEQAQASFELPADGDYVVEVASTRGNATYELAVRIV